jgi:hypothetical protein
VTISDTAGKVLSTVTALDSYQDALDWKAFG